MHECCGNEEKERTFGQIFTEAINTNAIIYQTLIIFAFFALIAYSFFKSSPIVDAADALSGTEKLKEN